MHLGVSLQLLMTFKPSHAITVLSLLKEPIDRSDAFLNVAVNL